MVFSFFVIFIMSISLLRGFVQSAKPSDILAYVFIGLILGVLRVVNRSGDIARKEIGGVMPRIENLPKIHLAGIISMITLWGSIIAEIIKNYLTEDPSKTLLFAGFLCTVMIAIGLFNNIKRLKKDQKIMAEFLMKNASRKF